MKNILLGLVFLVGSLAAREVLIDQLQTRVGYIIEKADELPELKSEAFQTLKGTMLSTWNELVEKGVLEVTGTDQEVRPIFVGLQGIVEHVLADELHQRVHNLRGVILTPMPPTPLCTKGAVSRELVDFCIQKDPFRKLTIPLRASTLRDYLYKGGVLIAAYPKGGLEKRTVEQQAIYKSELENYPQGLIDSPLDCSSIDKELIGATYLFKDSKGQLFAFAIHMTQANDPQENGQFALWFGKATHPAINARLDQVFDFIKDHTPVKKPS